MSAFVSREPVAVTDDEGNTIYIRSKMDYGVRSRVLSAITKMHGSDMTTDMGAYNLALLRENIVRWEGPAFDGVAFAPDLVEQLDPDLPVVDRALAEINQRNTKAATPEKKS